MGSGASLFRPFVNMQTFQLRSGPCSEYIDCQHHFLVHDIKSYYYLCKSNHSLTMKQMSGKIGVKWRNSV